MLQVSFLDTTLDKMEGTFKSFGRRGDCLAGTTGVGVGEDSLEDEMGERVEGKARGGADAKHSPLGIRIRVLRTSIAPSAISRA